MLVLLIVFMISAPLMQQGVKVNLPKANAGGLEAAKKQIVLTITKAQKILIDGKPAKKESFQTQLETIAQKNPGVQIFVRADETVSYGFVTQVIAELKKANLTRVGLVTQPGSAKLNW